MQQSSRMKKTIPRKIYSLKSNQTFSFIFTLFLIFILIANGETIGSLVLGATALLIYLIMISNLVGKVVFPDREGVARVWLGLLYFFVSFSLVGGLFLYIYKLNTLTIGITFVSVTIAFYLFYMILDSEIIKPTFKSLNHTKEEPEELKELLKIRGVGLARARVLFNVGYKTLKDIQRSKIEDLAKVPKISKGIAKKIKESVNLLLAENEEKEETKEKISAPYTYADISLIISFIIMSIICFYLLLDSRTGEMIFSIWDTIPTKFLAAYFVTGFLLIAFILNCEGRTEVKLLFLIIFLLLTSLAMVIIYEVGFGSDSWLLLGYERVVIEEGRSDLGDFFALLEGRGEIVMVVTFVKLLNLDVYWLHLLFVPLMWSFFVPIITYEIAKLVKPNDDRFAVLCVFSLFMFPLLTYYGSFQVPQTLGFFFFYCALFLWYRYLLESNKWRFFFALIATAASGINHPLIGAIMVISIPAILFIKKIQINPLTLVDFSLRPWSQFIYKITPDNLTGIKKEVIQILILALILSGAIPLLLIITKPIVFVNYLSTSKDWLTIILGPYIKLYSTATKTDYLLYNITHVAGLLFGLIGLIIARNKVNSRLYLLSVFLVALLYFDYLILNYSMDNLPFEPYRFFGIMGLILIPYTTMGLIACANALKAFLTDLFNLSVKSVYRLNGRKSRLKRLIPLYLILKRSRHNHNYYFKKARSGHKAGISKMFAIFLGGIIIASLVTMVTYKAFPKNDSIGRGWASITDYEYDAIKYIDETTQVPYVVLSDDVIGNVGFGMFSNESEDYDRWCRNWSDLYPIWLDIVYESVVHTPTLDYFQKALNISNSEICYFIINARWGFNVVGPVVEHLSPILKIYGIFGEGELYIFRYPSYQTNNPDDGSGTSWAENWENETNWSFEPGLIYNNDGDIETIEIGVTFSSYPQWWDVQPTTWPLIGSPEAYPFFEIKYRTNYTSGAVFGMRFDYDTTGDGSLDRATTIYFPLNTTWTNYMVNLYEYLEHPYLIRIGWLVFRNDDTSGAYKTEIDWMRLYGLYY